MFDYKSIAQRIEAKLLNDLCLDSIKGTAMEVLKDVIATELEMLANHLRGTDKPATDSSTTKSPGTSSVKSADTTDTKTATADVSGTNSEAS